MPVWVPKESRLERKLKSFSKKLSFIILGLVSYYDAESYLYDVDYGDDG